MGKRCEWVHDAVDHQGFFYGRERGRAVLLILVPISLPSRPWTQGSKIVRSTLPSIVHYFNAETRRGS